VFHAITSFSVNSPGWFWKDYDEDNQEKWHCNFGGILEYGGEYPINQRNVEQAIIATPVVMEIPFMGPLTEAQQNYVDSK